MKTCPIGGADDLFDMMRRHNLYLVPCSVDGWYVGHWDKDWEARDDGSLGRLGSMGDTPAMALTLYLKANATPDNP
jgi:hypothetical protein